MAYTSLCLFKTFVACLGRWKGPIFLGGKKGRERDGETEKGGGMEVAINTLPLLLPYLIVCG